MKFQISIKPFGNQALLIEWPSRIEDAILDDMIQFLKVILKLEFEKLADYTSGFNSILLQYNDPIDWRQKASFLTSQSVNTNDKINTQTTKWEIPVCYDEELGYDLPLFIEKGLSKEEVIDIHTAQPFRVYMIGFLPGFLYLGGLPKDLHMARKDKPKLKIAKGSIGIGGEQTGIYPMDSPGGWNIIGQTPISLFDIERKIPTPIKQGDYIQFYPITRQKFDDLLHKNIKIDFKKP